MNIYPAIDIKNGRVVRLLQGRSDQETAYYENPSEPAKLWLEAGCSWVHVVDLDGAFSGEPKNWPSVEKIVSSGAKVEFGGGMRNRDHIERAILAGVSRVVIGTRAVEDSSFIKDLVESFGEKIAVGIDAKNGKVAVRGWVDTSEVDALDLARRVEDLGVQTIIYTDISRDGMMQGPNFDAQREILGSVSCRIIASGGVSSHEDVHRFARMAQEHTNLDGVIIGKAIYEGTVDLTQLLRELADEQSA